MIVVMIRTRKAGSVNMITYLSSSFLYTKAANFVLWFYADVRYGLFYTALVIGMWFVYIYVMIIKNMLQFGCHSSKGKV